jgi:hypothetical protein
MQRAANYYCFLILLGAVALAGCALMPDPAFDALPKELTLRVIDAKPSPSRSSIDFSFELTNKGRTTARACLGPSRSVAYHVDYNGGSSLGSWNDLVDHPGCVRQFAIEPGGALTWDETIEIGERRQGRLEVTVDVQITNPSRCGGWGNCSAFDLTSDKVGIP